MDSLTSSFELVTKSYDPVKVPLSAMYISSGLCRMPCSYGSKVKHAVLHLCTSEPEYYDLHDLPDFKYDWEKSIHGKAC